MSRVFVAAVLVALCAAQCATAERWILDQRLEKATAGQLHYNFSDSIDVIGRLAVIGSTSENMGRGLVRVFYDYGSGFHVVATLKDPDGAFDDKYGAFVRILHKSGNCYLAVSATAKNDGAVLIYQSRDWAHWDLSATLRPPEGEWVQEFGRLTHFDGSGLIVSAVSRYKTSRRFVFGVLNVRGTRFFEESTGISPIPADPIFVFWLMKDRGNSTRWALRQTIRQSTYEADFGASLAISGDRMAIGAAPRDELRYGHGADGDLEVTGVKMLDGAFEYNFNSIVVRNGGVLTVDRYETLRGHGGIISIRVKNGLIVEAGGVINATAAGFEGAPTAFTIIRPPETGMGPGGGNAATSEFTDVFACDYDGSSTRPSELEALANSSLPFAEANGGGGSYGTKGQAGTTVRCGVSGAAGSIYGDTNLAELHRGSGGGAGHPWKVGSGGQGGNGGGAIRISARTLENYGTIEACGGRGSNGGYYSGGGGGGSGGSIFLQGGTLRNYAKILAVGGQGGLRARGTGSEGDPGVKGGDGGDGRVRLNFLTTDSYGLVTPHPKNTTNYGGEIHLFRRSAVTMDWMLVSTVPRLPSMMFIGHSVGLHGHNIAIGSDECSSANARQHVYLLDISLVQNSSSPFPRSRVISPPSSADQKFGAHISLDNVTIVVGAPGSERNRGAVYIYQGRDLYSHTTRMTQLTASVPDVGDGYGLTFAHHHPFVLVQHPTWNKEFISQPHTTKDIGAVELFKYRNNISAAHSFVACEYSTVTANVTLECTLNTRDTSGIVVGDISDVAFFTQPVNPTFVHAGKYSFEIRPSTIGTFEVVGAYRHERLASMILAVTPPINPSRSNLTCSPMTVNAGKEVTCTIEVNRGAGEVNAAREFHVVVYNMAGTQLVVTESSTPVGIYRSPPSEFVSVPPLIADFPTTVLTVSFVRHGIYSFSFVPWRAGPYAAFVRYQNRHLEMVNPSIVTALTPAVSVSHSTLQCPSIAAPNRTMSCLVHLRGADLVPAGFLALLHNFSNPRYVEARMSSGATLDVSTAWAGEGRFALLLFPTIEGTLTVEVRHLLDGISGSPASVDVKLNYALKCTKTTKLFQSWQILDRHAKGRADDIRYGPVAARAEILEGFGLCDDPYV